MNAMTVECDRGVPEQEGRGRNHTPLPAAFFSGSRRLGLPTFVGRSVNDGLRLDQTFLVINQDRVLQRDETERSSPAGLGSDVSDARHAAHRVSYVQIAMEGYRPACPHPPRQWHWGQEAAFPWMPVRP